MEITYPDHTSTFDVDPERLTIRAADGTVLETRDDPRASYPPFDPDTTARDRIQLAYFHSTSNWNHLTTPFVFTDQVFYFGDDFLLRRLDYSPDATSNPPVAHYVYDYREFTGFRFPTRRIVRLHDGDGDADMDFVPIAVDVVELGVQ